MGTDGLTLTCPSSTAAAWDRAMSQQEFILLSLGPLLPVWPQMDARC